MCAITGFFDAQGLKDGDSTVIKGMTKMMIHRGPDGFGEYLDAKNGLALGHARLSIIGLDAGQQPLVQDGGAYAAVVNGEFYDYQRLRARSALEGEHFQTKSDSELVIHLYRHHGLGMLEMLRGEFAFALFDRKKKRLILVRDRFGIRPLFYRVQGSRLSFASEMKAFLSQPEFKPAINPRAALHQLMQVMEPGMTLFEGVKALLPGHALIIEAKDGGLQIQEKTYWDMVYPRESEKGRLEDPDEAVRLVRDTLTDAVYLRQQADVPVGCYLSGGIDSCSMLGLASAVQQHPVRAYTIGFDHGDYDETPLAQSQAKRTGAEHILMPLKARDLYGDSFIRTVWHAERSFYNTLGVAKFHMSARVHAQGDKVVVTGEGADELFGGYAQFQRDMFRHAGGSKPDEASPFVGSILSDEEIRHPAFDERMGFTPAWVQPWLQAGEAARPLLSTEFRTGVEGYDPGTAVANSLDPNRLEGRHALDRSQYSWIKTMLEGQILNWGGDRVDMANAMESRPAYLDHRLAELATRLAPELRIREGKEKWVLKEAVRHVVTDDLYNRKKFAFMAPPAHLDAEKEAEVQALAQRYLSPSAVLAAGVLDPAAVETFMEQRQREDSPSVRIRMDGLLNHMLCLQILHDQFVAGNTPQPNLAAAAAV